MKPFNLSVPSANSQFVVSVSCERTARNRTARTRNTTVRIRRGESYGRGSEKSNVSTTGLVLPRRLLVALLTTLFIASVPTYSIAEATAVEAARSDSRDLHVVVKKGESLSSILQRELESVEDWKLVVRTNKIAAPDKLLPGDVIVIPHSLVQKRNYARLAFAKGTAELIRAITQTVEKVKKGLKVFVGDAIKTGRDGFVSLTFRDSSLVNIQPNSEIIVEKLECFDKTVSCVISLRATEGELNLDVGRADFAEPTRFTIDTPYASAAVRGTNFDFDIREGNVLGVTEGEVKISMAGQASLVPIGKGTLAGEGHSIATIYDLLLAAEFPEFVNFSRVSTEDLLQWEDVVDADRYLVAFATDEAMTNIVTAIANNVADQDATVALSNVQPGDYFFAVRAVDKNGLKGFAATTKLRQVSIDKNVGPDLDIEIVDQKMEIRSDSAETLEIRVGNELRNVNGLDRLLQYQTYELEAGKTLELNVESNPNWYLTAREILSERSVSSYGGLYEYKADR